MPPKTTPPPLPYKRNDHFLSKSELSFYRALKEVMGPNITICPKVRLIDLVIILATPEYQAAKNRVISKHIDFLLCSSATMQTLAAIELNGPSHKSAHRQERDQLVCSILEATAIPLFEFPVQESYTTQDILKHLSANNIPKIPTS